jgi:fibronectin-binding autotransporter adhesin
MLLKKVAAIFFINFILLLCFSKLTWAATVTWDGEGDTGTCGAGNENDWSCAENWSGDSVPTTSDVATFDNTSDDNCTIDSAISVLGIDINSGYDGTITQSAGITIGSTGFAQDDGTFTGGSDSIDIGDGSFAVNAGSFTSTSGTLYTERNFTINSGATFTHNSGTITFDGASGSDDSTLTCGNKTLNLVTISKSYFLYRSLTIGSDCTIPLGNSPTITKTNTTNNGTVTAGTGTWTISGDYTQSDAGASTTFTGTAIDTSGSITFSNGSFTADSLATLNIERSLNNSGNLLPTGLDVIFDGNGDSDNSTVTCSGNEAFNSVTITKSYVVLLNVVIGANCTIPLGNSPTTSGANITNNGTVTVGTGTWTLSNTDYTQSDSGGSTTFTGTTIDSGGSITLTDGSFTADNLTTLSVARNLNNSGDLLPTGLDVAFDGNASGNDTTVTCSGNEAFNSATISKAYVIWLDVIIGVNCIIPLGNSPTSSGSDITNNGTITIGTGTWTLNGSYTQSDAGGSTTFTGTTIDSSGLITLTAGSFTASSMTTLNVEKDLDNSGDLLPAGLDVTFDGTDSNDDSTLTCGGGEAFNSLTINKSSSTAYTKFDSNCTVAGALTRTNGPVSNSDSAYTLAIQGNFSMSTTDAFGGANLTVKLSGSNAQTIAQNAANAFSCPFQIDKSGNAATLATNLTTTTEDCDVVEGNFSLDSYTFSCGGTFTVEGGGVLQMIGSEGPTTPTLDSLSTVEYLGNGDANPNNYTAKEWSYHNLTSNFTDSDDSLDASGISSLTIGGNLSITSGTLDTASTLNVGGNWSNSGEFTHNDGVVVLNGTSQSISDSTTFYNFEKEVASADTLTFEAESTQIFEGTMLLKGASSNLLSLRSSIEDTQWEIDPQGTRSIEYLDVQDSANVNAEAITTSELNITNSGNNTNWTFSATTSLTFFIGGVGANTVTNAITTSFSSAYNTLPFSNLAVNEPKYIAHQLDVTTNAASGYTVKMKMLSTLQGNYPLNDIDEFAADSVAWETPQVWSSPTGTVKNVNTGWIGANTSDTRVTGWSSASGKFGPVNTVSHDVMYSSTADESGTSAYITYAVEINILQTSDLYAGIIIYNVLPTY